MSLLKKLRICTTAHNWLSAFDIVGITIFSNLLYHFFFVLATWVRGIACLPSPLAGHAAVTLPPAMLLSS